MLVVTDSARESLTAILATKSAQGKSLVLYLQGAG